MMILDKLPSLLCLFSLKITKSKFFQVWGWNNPRSNSLGYNFWGVVFLHEIIFIFSIDINVETKRETKYTPFDQAWQDLKFSKSSERKKRQKTRILLKFDVLIFERSKKNANLTLKADLSKKMRGRNIYKMSCSASAALYLHCTMHT